MRSLILMTTLLACLGCSSNSDSRTPDAPVERVKDPVCGMEIDTRATRRVEFYGGTYYFCSDECYEAFRRTPEAYMISRRPRP